MYYISNTHSGNSGILHTNSSLVTPCVVPEPSSSAMDTTFSPGSIHPYQKLYQESRPQRGGKEQKPLPLQTHPWKNLRLRKADLKLREQFISVTQNPARSRKCRTHPRATPYHRRSGSSAGLVKPGHTRLAQTKVTYTFNNRDSEWFHHCGLPSPPHPFIGNICPQTPPFWFHV